MMPDGEGEMMDWMDERVKHTSFPFGERYMTSRFILNKFDLDLSSSCLLVRFGLFLLVVVVCGRVDGILVVDECVLCDRGRGLLVVDGLRVSRWGSGVWGVDVEGALSLAHDGGDR
jgi:hypothetical protein